MNEPLFLFYEEPDPDRWFPGDRHPRRLIRRLVRGRPRPGGVMRWFLNLRAGLEEIGQPVRVNDYRGLRRSPGAVACVVGKPHVVGQVPSGHPILYGPGIDDHPCKSGFWGKADIALIAAPCEWFRAMYARDLPLPIPTAVWPAGIETGLWRPPVSPRTGNRVLVYDKIRWRREEYEGALLNPILARLREAGLAPEVMRYGFYREEDYRRALNGVRAMVFLCEHETQGFAYLQALSCGVPILGWDRGGPWQDPQLYPDKVVFGPVSSMPYFDSRCGERFADPAEFARLFPGFWANVEAGKYVPRDYVVENLTLAGQARAYLSLVEKVKQGRCAR